MVRNAGHIEARRKSRAFVRQGNFLFIPVRDTRVIGSPVVLHDEPLWCDGGVEPHVAESCVRAGGVYVRGRIRHPDHATLVLERWHRVVVSTTPADTTTRQVVFLN